MVILRAFTMNLSLYTFHIFCDKTQNTTAKKGIFIKIMFPLSFQQSRCYVH
jgi:hypothetical protein